jgi:hypothetical protein
MLAYSVYAAVTEIRAAAFSDEQSKTPNRKVCRNIMWLMCSAREWWNIRW